MITPDETISLAGQHALQDMVELEMYLLAQPQQTPWSILLVAQNDSSEPGNRIVR